MLRWADLDIQRRRKTKKTQEMRNRLRIPSRLYRGGGTERVFLYAYMFLGHKRLPACPESADSDTIHCHYARCCQRKPVWLQDPPSSGYSQRMTLLSGLSSVRHCGGLTLAGHQVPTKAALSLTSSAGQGRENITKGSWVEIRTGRDPSPITITGKTDLTWGKINLIYYQSNQSRVMRNKTKS